VNRWRFVGVVAAIVAAAAVFGLWLQLGATSARLDAAMIRIEDVELDQRVKEAHDAMIDRYAAGLEGRVRELELEGVVTEFEKDLEDRALALIRYGDWALQRGILIDGKAPKRGPWGNTYKVSPKGSRVVIKYSMEPGQPGEEVVLDGVKPGDLMVSPSYDTPMVHMPVRGLSADDLEYEVCSNMSPQWQPTRPVGCFNGRYETGGQAALRRLGFVKSAFDHQGFKVYAFRAGEWLDPDAVLPGHGWALRDESVELLDRELYLKPSIYEDWTTLDKEPALVIEGPEGWRSYYVGLGQLIIYVNNTDKQDDEPLTTLDMRAFRLSGTEEEPYMEEAHWLIADELRAPFPITGR
jgi:hypothetical protein